MLKNVFNRRQFYHLMAIRFGFTICIYTVPAYYKAFGLALDCEFIKTEMENYDDRVTAGYNFLERGHQIVQMPKGPQSGAHNKSFVVTL